jgi:hypothetical protein
MTPQSRTEFENGRLLDDLVETAFGEAEDEPEMIPGYGDLSVDVPHGVLHVWWKGDPPVTVQAAFTSAPSGIRVEVHQSRYSSAELSAAEERLLDEDRPSNLAADVEAIVPTMHGTSHLDGASGVEVEYSADGSETELTQRSKLISEALTALVGLPVTAVVAPEGEFL